MAFQKSKYVEDYRTLDFDMGTDNVFLFFFKWFFGFLIEFIIFFFRLAIDTPIWLGIIVFPGIALLSAAAAKDSGGLTVPLFFIFGAITVIYPLVIIYRLVNREKYRNKTYSLRFVFAVFGIIGFYFALPFEFLAHKKDSKNISLPSEPPKIIREITRRIDDI